MLAKKPQIEKYADKESLSVAAADKVVATANAAIAEHGFFTIALAGGSTPKLLYALLASPDYQAQTNWA